MSNVRALINFVLREHGLPTNSAFSGVYLGEVDAPKKRYVPTASELRTLQDLCYAQDDELRWIIGIIINTGIRLSEAVGLSKDDLFFGPDIPYLRVLPQPWRRLKTLSSDPFNSPCWSISVGRPASLRSIWEPICFSQVLQTGKSLIQLGKCGLKQVV